MNRANSVLILGHTVSGMGERTLAQKFNRVLNRAGYETFPVVDIIQLMGNEYGPLAQLNYDLADAGNSLMEDLRPPPALEKSDLLLILSWCFSVAALMATGVHKTRPTVVKLYAHHPNERILTPLYQPADLVITESLLGSERARAYGIDPGKTLYLPHCYPAEYENLAPSRTYVERLAQEQGKPLGRSTRVIGCVSRLEYGKNCEWAVEAVRLLAAEGKDVVLVLKGDFPEITSYPDFKPAFSEMLKTYRDEPWLLWDPKPTPFPQVLEEYASFDLLLHPSGAEGGSNVVVECLGLGKPVVVLNCSTNPSLFKEVATFVPVDPTLRPGPIPFFVPVMEDLCRALTGELFPPDPEKVRKRFHEKNLQERLPLLFSRDSQIIQGLYHDDCISYGL